VKKIVIGGKGADYQSNGPQGPQNEESQEQGSSLAVYA
jgi:hypothetical protein